MGIARRALLALSGNRRLSRWATTSTLVRRSVSPFMPGERLEDAVAAATQLRSQGIGCLLTRLGENLASPAEAAEVAAHYLTVMETAVSAGLDAFVSVKPTQLGLDLDSTLCERLVQDLAVRAAASDRSLWIDMEGSVYVEPTLRLVQALRSRSLPVGVAVQAYLHRSAGDIDALLDAHVAIRLVKGAYLEPPTVAMPRKADVDENYFRLAARLLDRTARDGGPAVHLATHDDRLIDRLRAFIVERGIPPSASEFAMLYGIRAALQRRLVDDGQRVRVLISYGPHWFPWYMRRLAERPANLWFLARSVGRR
jgi:proline dehydrogenase